MYLLSNLLNNHTLKITQTQRTRTVQNISSSKHFSVLRYLLNMLSNAHDYHKLTGTTNRNNSNITFHILRFIKLELASKLQQRSSGQDEQMDQSPQAVPRLTERPNLLAGGEVVPR